MKVILDTNVFMSGIFWSGPPYQILEAWRNHQISLVLSEEILEEYERVVTILSKKYPSVSLSPFIELLTIHSEIYVPMKLSENISRDPDDDKFIACALSAGVKLIVSGDRDLLDILNYKEIEMMTPANFVKCYL